MATSLEVITRWRLYGPALFAMEALGAEPTEQQWEASVALVKTRRVSIRSGHGTGKSAFMAWTVMWFLVCYFPCKAPCTAPTAHQLSDILWAEIARWHRVLGERYPDIAKEFGKNTDRYYLLSHPEESFAVARTARQENPEALQGFHAENLLFAIDEASGVAEAVFQVAEGALSTEGAFVVMAANPTRQDGYFFESHHKMRDRWTALHWDGRKSPLVSKQYIDDMTLKYGIDSPIFQVRVAGNFVTAADGVIPLDWCISARDRDVKPFANATEIWGLDVARFGDDNSALAKRRGNVQVEPIQEWHGLDIMQTAGKVYMQYQDARNKPMSINIDVIGMGAGVVDRLKELGLPVVGINVSESASVSDRYQRLRDELWFLCRDWLEAKDCKLADDDALIAELTTVKYNIAGSSGKIKVEGKDEMKKRGVASPNRADAWNLTFARVAPSNARWGKPIKYPDMGII